jgi:hypothetical protein
VIFLFTFLPQEIRCQPYEKNQPFEMISQGYLNRPEIAKEMVYESLKGAKLMVARGW